MKFNSKLWMLAVAMATVGCQDDLENDPNSGGSGVVLDGEKALITVSVNTGISTRANPEPGETGNGDEPGTTEESKVKNLTVFLFRNTGDAVATDFAFKSSSTLCAAGYVANDGDMSTGSPIHSFYKEMEITSLQPNATLVDGGAYGVIAIANLGETAANTLMAKLVTGDDATTKGSDLADEIQKSLGNATDGFVMSTHTMGLEYTGEESTVIPVNVSSTEESPLVNVYVERLAAKIRINEYNNNGFVYDVTNHNGDKVILNNVAIVNQLTSGSYMIKRVTKDATNASDDIDDNGTNFPVANDEYLGDEETFATSPNAGKNFVIDPWTRNKKAIADEATTVSVTGLAYTNPFVPGTATDMPGYWNSLASGEKHQLYNNAEWVDGEPLNLCYTMENTTSIAASENGYSTGALFQATYYPASWMVADAAASDSESGSKSETNTFSATETTGEGESQTTTTTYTAKDFYLYEGAVFKDKAAIFAYDLAKANANATTTVFKYGAFAGEDMSSFKLSDFLTSVSAGANDTFGYIAYLKSLAEEENPTIPTFAQFLANANNVYEDYLIENPANVEFREKGIAFYPMWIRHANNGSATDTGIMEFGIVRNNIYDLTIEGVDNYGTVEPPKPGTPDEKTQVGLRAVVYVRNWTLRTNDGIIL